MLKITLLEPDADTLAALRGGLQAHYVPLADHPDVIVMDPAVDTDSELCVVILRLRRLVPDAKIVIASGRADVGIIATGYGLGAITKPYHVSELRELIEVIIGHGEMNEGYGGRWH